MTTAETASGLLRGRLTRLLPAAGPARALAAATLVTSIGFGGYTAGSVLFFTRAVGLPVTEVGAGLSVAGLLALLGNPFFGSLADRFGARRVVLALGLVQTIALLVCTQVHSFVTYLALVCVLGLAENGGYVCRGALTSAAVGGANRVRVSAYLRSALNAGFALGALAAGVALGMDTPAAYRTLIVAAAVLTAAGHACYLLIPSPPVPAVPARAHRRRAPVRDYPYVLCGLLCALVALSDTVLLVGLPVWVVSHTAAPRPLAVLLIGLNTVLVVLLQVRASRSGDTVAGARRLVRHAALALAAACVVFGLVAAAPGWLAVLGLLAGTVALTAAEMWNSAATWGLAFNLAPADSQGAHLGAFSIGTTLRTVSGPVLVAGLTAMYGTLGWLILAGLILVAVPSIGPAVAWAQRSRATAAGTPVLARAA
jgi:MFS family permease